MKREVIRIFSEKDKKEETGWVGICGSGRKGGWVFAGPEGKVGGYLRVRKERCVGI